MEILKVKLEELLESKKEQINILDIGKFYKFLYTSDDHKLINNIINGLLNITTDNKIYNI